METKFTKNLKTPYDTTGLKKVTIKGRIGTLTFYSHDLTNDQAQKKYETVAQALDNFWEANQDTYFASHPEDLDMKY